MKQGIKAIMAAIGMLACGVWAQSAGDQAVLAMQQAFVRADQQALVDGLPSTKGHVLEPLARYWTMKVQLETASASDIRAAMGAMAGSYWEDRLRNDWLRQLGESADWALFDAELPHFRMNDDNQVRCHAVHSGFVQRRLSGPVAAQSLLPLWLSQGAAEPACSGAARILLAAGDLAESVLWLRARQAVDARQVGAAAEAIGLRYPDRVAAVQALYRDPEAYLQANPAGPATAPGLGLDGGLVLLALTRLARLDSEAAAAALRQRPPANAEARDWLWGTVGKWSAIDWQANALDHFAQVPSPRLAADQLAWMARAALREGLWLRLREAVQAMPEQQQQAPVWTYWLARSWAQDPGGDPINAQLQRRALLVRIAGNEGFYPQLALEALGQKVSAGQAPPAPPTAAERRAAAQNPGLQRALAAFALGLRSQASREWHYTVALHQPGGMSDRALLAAAELACQLAIWDRCINTSSRTLQTAHLGQRFPTPHLSLIQTHAQTVGLEPALLLGLMRQESRFVNTARSGVGAAGLMQLMPATAAETARRVGLVNFQPAQVNDVDINLRLGSAYLRRVWDAFDGAAPLALAGYNAGSGRARQWRNGPPLDADVWAETLPFNETRLYVQHVLSNATLYAAMLSGQPQSLRARLGRVQAPQTLGAPS